MLIEDERTTSAMARTPSLTKLIAIARVLNAYRLIAARYEGKGEVRYATNADPPELLLDAVTRAGASLSDGSGTEVIVPAMPAAIAPIIDQSFAELAHQLRAQISASTMADALAKLEDQRRKAKLDRDAKPALYWTAVFELCAVAGELSRAAGGRWIDTSDIPVPYAIKFPDQQLAHPDRLAQQLVEGAFAGTLAAGKGPTAH